MRARFEHLLEKWGERVLWTPVGGESCEIRVFLQSVLKKREELPVTATALGPVSDQRWLCWCAHALGVGDSLDRDELALIVQEVQTMTVGGETVFHRAVLRRRKERA